MHSTSTQLVQYRHIVRLFQKELDSIRDSIDILAKIRVDREIVVEVCENVYKRIGVAQAFYQRIGRYYAGGDMHEIECVLHIKLMYIEKRMQRMKVCVDNIVNNGRP